jgi:dTDP-4-amino-4,6-dideoxygalactose transaminase
LFGHPANLEPILEACARYGVAIIEDAAEALGARWVSGGLAGRHVGTVGRVGCFSFNGNKVITCGGGGMLTTDDEQLARRAKHLTTQARMAGHEYQHDELGYNYRLTNLAAALGVAQLEQLPRFLEQKRAIATRYDTALRSIRGLGCPPRAPWAAPTFWLYSVLVDSREYGCDSRALLARLLEHGVSARPIWTPLHKMPLYRDAQRLGGDAATELFERAVSLPSSVGLTIADQERVVAALR